MEFWKEELSHHCQKPMLYCLFFYAAHVKLVVNSVKIRACLDENPSKGINQLNDIPGTTIDSCYDTASGALKLIPKILEVDFLKYVQDATSVMTACV